MWRWDRPEVPAERQEIGTRGRDPPEPTCHEAHRRTRTFDPDTGALTHEVHEAVRVKYGVQNPVQRQLQPVGASGTDPHPVVGIVLGALLHASIWWGVMSILAFAGSPWWAVAAVLAIPIALGWRFFLVHVLVALGLSSLLLGLDSWASWGFAMLLAGGIAPGKWVVGEW